MKIDDYKWCAQKHLKTCSRMLDYFKSNVSSDDSATEQEKSDFLLEIYYLLGYVIEGLAVYIAHTMPYTFTTDNKTGAISSHSWKSDSATKKNKDVSDFNAHFTQITGIYFYNAKLSQQNNKLNSIEKRIAFAYQNNSGDNTKGFDFYCNSDLKMCRDDLFYESVGKYLKPKCMNSTTDSEISVLYDEMQMVIQREKNNIETFLKSIRYDIMGHHFNRASATKSNATKPQPIIGFVEGFIFPKMSQINYISSWVPPSKYTETGAIPYFGSQSQPDLDPDVKFLIDNWSTEIRYVHNSFGSTVDQDIASKVTIDNLMKFKSTCEKIISMLLPYGL